MLVALALYSHSFDLRLSCYLFHFHCHTNLSTSNVKQICEFLNKKSVCFCHEIKKLSSYFNCFKLVSNSNYLTKMSTTSMTSSRNEQGGTDMPQELESLRTLNDTLRAYLTHLRMFKDNLKSMNENCQQLSKVNSQWIDIVGRK
ncbi:hypothetical protein MSG28_015183 [Choristoneura fumiferana]|uniref:Uncharacterized protein n=2 Tax=Choristoneura fumiferana TaxID=7141 RepID=A0ACC0KYN2_CHOFU|nr:hypothetical protein MSG28_015183 [Choristoneura fumiferana]